MLAASAQKDSSMMQQLNALIVLHPESETRLKRKRGDTYRP
jgi:hypothetical protein